MKQIFKDYLFEKHILVSDSYELTDREHRYETCFNSLIALAHLFGIRVMKGAEFATEDMIHDAERNLGNYVPEPFYRGFPESVREMTQEQLIFDQLYHYAQTYGMGWFDRSGHSIFENHQFFERTSDISNDELEAMNAELKTEQRNRIQRETFYKMAFKGTEWDSENGEVHEDYVSPVKEFTILKEVDALRELLIFTRELSGSNRPLNRSQMDLIAEAYRTYPNHLVLSKEMPCKKTVVTLMYDLRNRSFAKHLQLSDVMKLVEYIQYRTYGKEKVNQLNLKNQDRKFITDVIHEVFRQMEERYYTKTVSTFHGFMVSPEILDCFTRRQDWKGLLHHLHFKPVDAEETKFCRQIRDPKQKNLSAESAFEYAIIEEKPAEAARILKTRKGSGAVLRNLNYILSRCSDEKEIEEVFSCLE